MKTIIVLLMTGALCSAQESPRELKNARHAYDQQHGKLKATYIAKLKQIQQDLTKQGRLDDALKVRAEIEGLEPKLVKPNVQKFHWMGGVLEILPKGKLTFTKWKLPATWEPTLTGFKIDKSGHVYSFNTRTLKVSYNKGQSSKIEPAK